MQNNKVSGTLYIVGTPIGNMGDISERALQTLAQADIIACEDTRRSRVLLDKFGIAKRLISYHKHNEQSGSEYILELLDEGNNIALISDAGMPCISDPGAAVVTKARQGGYNISSVPGPTALTTALALAGVDGAFTFLGFLPEKLKDRTALLNAFEIVPCALVFYCSPHDILRDLGDMYEILGARDVYVVREITKLYEEVAAGKLGEIDIGNPRGEYVVIVGKPAPSKPQGDIMSQLRQAIEVGMDKKSAIKKVAKDNNLPKDAVYKVAMSID
ncbi:MAG: 16S rRNA (cytidine(1402)-2'-O)-methyltransferase [Clostridia bacterium]|nr:16S rRNA (cytidine(1402)-2'-O)-methyltransferase [Clostridia bacterium]